jgi:NAD(P)-dependent dehydrogenase (short-subunit alcohol dehydrogenase family)
MPDSNTGVLRGKVAVVTGGGTGIGRAIAAAFASEGAAVIVAGRTATTLERVAAETGARAVPADVANERDVVRLFDHCAAHFGRLDVLVNNAGVTGPISTAETMPLEQWDETFAINVRGVLLCIKHALPLMPRIGGGSIINLSSLTGLRGYPMRSAYAATKFAVIGITESVAQEVGPRGIRVNALCPGAVHGELMERVVARRAEVEGRDPAEIMKTSYTDVAALRKWVEPEEVARAAVFLASDASSGITGERIRVDAGRL